MKNIRTTFGIIFWGILLLACGIAQAAPLLASDIATATTEALSKPEIILIATALLEAVLRLFPTKSNLSIISITIRILIYLLKGFDKIIPNAESSKSTIEKVSDVETITKKKPAILFGHKE